MLGKTPLTADALHPMPVEEADLEPPRTTMHRSSPRLPDLQWCWIWCTWASATMATRLPWCPAMRSWKISDRDVAVSGDYRGYRRMTLTLPILDRARQRLWLVTGAGKAEMLARLCAGDHSIPAGRVGAGHDSICRSSGGR